MPIKILTIYPYPKAGGCFGQLVRAMGAVLERGGTVHYISSVSFPSLRSERLVFHMFPLYFKNELLFYFFFYLIAPFQVLFVTLRTRPDRILVFNEEFAALSLLSRLLSGVEIVLIIEGYIKTFAESKRFNPLIKNILFLFGRFGIAAADQIFAVSGDLANLVRGFYKTKKNISVLYNYAPKKAIESSKVIDLRGTLSLEPGSMLITCVARLIPRKNIEYLLKEFASAAGRKNAYILLAGSGPEKENLTALASRLGIAGRTVFLGERNDALDIIKSSDLIVLPTIHDDCPLAIIEALNLDVPCIASKVGGIPEVLHYDELMFDPKKRGDLTSKLERIIDEPGYLDSLGKLCSERKMIFNKDWGEEIVRLLGKNIFINAVSGIGENLLLVPTLRLLRKHIPDAKVVLAVRSPSVESLIGKSGLIDEIIVCDYRVQNTISKKIGLIKYLRGKKFDIAITAFPSNRLDKAVLSWLSGAPVRIFHDHDSTIMKLFGFLNSVYVPVDKTLHDLEQDLNLLKPLGIGINEADKGLAIWLDKKADEGAEIFLEKNNIKGPALFGLHPGSSSDLGMKNKRWPLDRFKELAEKLTDKYGATILVFLGPDEADLVFDAGPGNNKLFFVMERLDVSVALIKRCRLFVGNDSSLMHVSAILNVPTIGIFGPTNPARTSPRGDNARVLTGKTGSGLERLKSISVEDVLTLAENIQ
jgi:heptosyltransferase-2